MAFRVLVPILLFSVSASTFAASMEVDLRVVPVNPCNYDGSHVGGSDVVEVTFAGCRRPSSSVLGPIGNPHRMSAADGLTFLASTTRTTAFSIHGETVWTQDEGAFSIDAGGDLLYVARISEGHCLVRAFRQLDGNMEWDADVGPAYPDSVFLPILRYSAPEDALFLLYYDENLNARVVAFEAATGALRWSVALSEDMSPKDMVVAPTGGYLVIASLDDHAVLAADGSHYWTVSNDMWAPGVIFDGEDFFLLDSYDFEDGFVLEKYNLPSRALLWSQTYAYGFWGSIIGYPPRLLLRNDDLFVVSQGDANHDHQNDIVILKVDAKSGDLDWSAGYPPVPSDVDRTLQLLSPNGGEPIGLAFVNNSLSFVAMVGTMHVVSLEASTGALQWHDVFPPVRLSYCTFHQDRAVGLRLTDSSLVVGASMKDCGTGSQRFGLINYDI